MLAQDIIRKPIITERSMALTAEKKYTFAVPNSATKIDIKKAVEQIFDVEVEKVTTIRVMGKVKRMGANSGRRASWKKAIVKLTQDSKTIEFFESMI